jgi:hypothetical protein
MQKFWLDVTKDSELALVEQLEQKKKKRQYTATLRNALKLFFSLSNGDTSVLFELFPNLKKQLQPEPATSDLSAVLQQQTAILQAITSNAPMPHTAPAIDELPSIFSNDKIEISSKEVRLNMASGLGDLFGDSSDNDLWD